MADFNKNNKIDIKSISGGLLVQESDQKIITKSDLKLVSEKSINNDEIEQLLFAMNLCKHVKSNAIVIVKDFQLVGVGGGQTSRVDACEIACKKAGEAANNAYLASDAFFPFADNIEIAANANIRAIVAPQGSIRDSEVIDMANKKNIALYFVETRHFKH